MYGYSETEGPADKVYSLRILHTAWVIILNIWYVLGKGIIQEQVYGSVIK
jgi:hypothetical protein